MTEANPFKVDFVEDLQVKGKLGMTFAPGKKQENVPPRDVLADVKALKETHNADVLVSLLEDHEYKSLGIDNLFDACQQNGVDVLRYPIAEGTVPKSPEELLALVQKIKDNLEGGRNVVVHCKGGFGRTGLVTACALTGLGVPAEEAIDRVRKARPGTCEGKHNEDFVASTFPTPSATEDV